MPQPIFTSRNVTTSIVIWDGQTVVMGGLIREELTTIKDKIPILGDIPMLGWLFRTEGQNSRKNEPADLRDRSPGGPGRPADPSRRQYRPAGRRASKPSPMSPPPGWT